MNGNGNKKPRFVVCKGKIFRKEFVSFDIETYTRKRGQIGKFLFGGVYNGKQYLHFDNREDMKRFLTLNRWNGIIFCAHNLEYDLNRIFELDKYLIRYFLGSRLIFAEYPLNRGRVLFWDTSALSYYTPLAELGEKFKIKKHEIAFQDKITPRFVEYNKRDCEICYKFISDFQDKVNGYGGNIKGTAAGIAFDLFRREFMPKWAEYWEIPERIINDFRSAYYGGRCEVFDFNKHARVNYYDINSSYPSAMKKDFPLLDTWKNKPNIEKDGCSFVRVSVPEMKYPPLPFRGNKLLFPFGTWAAWYFNNELREMKSRVPEMKIKVIRGYHYKKSAPIFADYIDFVYNKRLHAETDSEKLILKLLMNSLYGRFGLSSELTKIQGANIEIIEGKKVFANVIWAGMITAFARVALYDLIVKSESIYCDTDSSLTEKEMKVSNKLGEISSKGEYRNFQAKGNKIYFYEKGKQIVRVIKGLNFKGKNPAVPVKGKENTWREYRPIKYKTAVRRNMPIYSWNYVDKHIKFEYDKRRILKDGSTLPLFVKGY